MNLHTMIDLETLCCKPYSSILQIGAVVFDPHSDFIGETLSVYLNELVGSTSIDTLAWWLNQSEQACKELSAGLSSPEAMTLKDALGKLAGLVSRNNAKHGVWSHGATFDIPIVRTAACRVGVKLPWNYYNEYDTRTLYLVKGKPTVEREGTHHNALADAIHQARCVQQRFKA